MGPKQELTETILTLKKEYTDLFGKAPKGGKCNDAAWLQSKIDEASASGESVNKRDRDEDVEKTVSKKAKTSDASKPKGAALSDDELHKLLKRDLNFQFEKLVEREACYCEQGVQEFQVSTHNFLADLFQEIATKITFEASTPEKFDANLISFFQDPKCQLYKYTIKEMTKEESTTYFEEVANALVTVPEKRQPFRKLLLYFMEEIFDMVAPCGKMEPSLLQVFHIISALKTDNELFGILKNFKCFEQVKELSQAEELFQEKWRNQEIVGPEHSCDFSGYSGTEDDGVVSLNGHFRNYCGDKDKELLSGDASGCDYFGQRVDMPAELIKIGATYVFEGFVGELRGGDDNDHVQAKGRISYYACESVYFKDIKKSSNTYALNDRKMTASHVPVPKSAPVTTEANDAGDY
jgi:hypothetical protein